MSSSSCGDFIREVNGRQGIGVTQPQSGTHYPFVFPSEDVRHLLADFWLSYDDPSDYPPNLSATPFKPPFRIHWLYGLGCEAAELPDDMPEPVHEADLIVVDADDVVVFDSTEATEFNTRAWGSRLRVYSWQTNDAVCRLVAHTAWPDTDEPEARDYPVHLLPENGVLDERAIERRPKRVKSLTVVLDNLTRQAVDFRAGFNMAIRHTGEVAIAGRRAAQQITFDATPGAGLGIFPGCVQPPLVIRSIRGIQPDANGNYYMAAKDCFYVRQPTTLTSSSPRFITPTPAMLTIGNDCAPCCACDDYVSTANYLNAIGNAYRELGRSIEASRDLYHDNRDRWAEFAACALRRPLRLQLQAQYCPTLDVVAQYCNHADECVGPVVLTLDFTDTGVTGSVVPGFTTRIGGSGQASNKSERYDVGGAWPVFTAVIDVVQPHSSAFVKFRLRFEDGCVTSPTPVVVAGSLSGTLAGLPIKITPEGETEQIVAIATTIEALDCPPAYPRVDPYRCCE